MITAEELVGYIEIDDGGSKITKMATVVELFQSGKPKLIFDGEDIPSEKEYEPLGSYIPTIGDRVLLLGASGTWVILGKMGLTQESGIADLVRAKQITADTQLWAKSTTYIDGTLYSRGYFQHTGQRVGFFNRAPTARKNCGYLGANPDLDTVKNKVNEVIQNLISFGLFS